MFPTIPESLDGLSGADLRALAAELRKACKARLEEIRTPDFDGDRAAALTEVQTHVAARDMVLAAAIAAEEADAMLAKVQDESDDEPAGDDNTIEDPGKDSETATVPTAEVPPDDPNAEHARGVQRTEDDESEASELTPARVRRHVGAAPGAAVATRLASAQFSALDGVDGKRPGDLFADPLELAAALIDRAGSIREDTDEHFPVGSIKGVFERRLTNDWMENLRMFEGEEMTAALCAPFTPNYNLACMNTTRRPVRASLPTFEAPRMGVKIYPSPTLADITGGYGQWTAAMDAAPLSNEKVCTTIVCGTPVDYQMYAVWRCITIQNMLQMSFPELVDAWLNRLAAAQARYAETLLLEAMAAGTNTVFVEDTGWSGATSVARAVLQYLNAYAELQRWDTGEMDVWLHRSVMNAMKADLMSRRNTSGEVLRVPTDGEINAMFTNAGVTPHWFLDRPSWMSPIPTFSVGGKVAQFPRDVEMLVAPRGKFALMDGGNLNIGVTGNNLYRDNTSNAHNNFTLFFENFEGIVNTTSCPAHIVELNNVCWNGQQIADVVLDCEGQDEPGIGS
jgi:hypothetical protein